MQSSLRFTRNRITFWMMSAFLLSTLVGQVGAVIFHLLSTSQITSSLRQGLYPAFIGLTILWSSYFAWKFIDPLFQWWHTHAKESVAAPAALWKRLRYFSYVFWSFFLMQSVIGSYLLLQSTDGVTSPLELPLLLKLIVCQAVACLMVGIPIYILVLEDIGQLVARLGLQQVHFGIRTKMFIMGALLPLMGYGLLVRYFETQGIGSPSDARMIWIGLVLSTLSTTFLSISSMRKSLMPVLHILSKSGASKNQDLAKLSAHSMDEIGYFSQMLGKLFSRLLEQESQVKTVIDKAAEGIIVLDEHGLIETFNRAAEDVFGYSASEVRGRSLRWLMPSVVQEDGLPNLLRNAQEVKGERKDSEERTLFFRVTQLQTGEKTIYSCLVHDITDRKNAERKLQKAESRYRNLVETAHDLVWSMDAEGRWTYLNEAAIGIYGYAPKDMIGHRFSDFQAPESIHQDQIAFERLLEGKELVQYETIHLDILDQSRYLSFNAKPVLNADGKIVKITGTARDITEQKAFEKRLAYQAEHDSLTGLFNRNYFNQELERVVTRASRVNAPCALFYIDLDQFKYVNDTLGHAAGDRLLIEISSLLQSNIRESDLLARFGGDEFTLLLYNTEKDQALWVAENLRSRFEQYRFFDSGNSFNVMCSIGITLVDKFVKTADEALSQADIACNLAKAHGRNRAEFFNPEQEDLQGMAEDMGWAARVRDMLEKDRLRLVFQPIVRTADGTICDYEVLMRMVCEDGQIIMPGGFLPAAERFGLIHSLDRWMVKKAIARLAQMHANETKVRFSINLSGRAFDDEQLLGLIHDELSASKLDPSLLTFEITETAAIANLAKATQFIHDLKNIGCQFALDDFGSGFCSFTYLKNLPVDKLKIDGSFIQNMSREPVDQAMVRSMNDIAHALGKKTIAEFVEDEQTFQMLNEMGVDYVQGNYLGIPREAILILDAQGKSIAPDLTIAGNAPKESRLAIL